MLLAKDRHGYNAWHRAADKSSLEALETLWSLAKEVELSPDELLLAQIAQGLTPLHKAAEKNHIENIREIVDVG